MTAPDATTPKARAIPLRTAVLVAFVFVAGVVRYAPFVHDPWDRTFASTVGACYTANVVRSYREVGFAHLRGEPHLYVQPTLAPEGVAYTNHPPVMFWLEYVMVRALGWNEAAFRVLPIVFSATSLALLFILVARYCGHTIGLAAAAIGLTVPMSFLYGWMAGYEPGILCFFMIGMLAHDTLRSRSLRAWWPAIVPCFLAPLIDWQGCFLVPGLLLYEILHPRGNRRAWRVVLLMGPAAALAVATIFALDVWWAGSLDEAHRLLRATRLASTSTLSGIDWMGRQVGYWVDLMTWPVSILTVGGLVVSAITARRDPLARLALAFFAMASLNVAVFAQRASDHDFWWFTGIPAAACCSVVVLRSLAGTSTLRRATCAVACVAISTYAGVESFRTYTVNRTTANRDVGRELSAIAGPRDLILFSTPMHWVQFYVDAWTYAPVLDPHVLRVLASKRDPSLLVERFVFVTSSAFDDPPELTQALPSLGRMEHLSQADLRARMPHCSGLPDLTIVHLGE